MKQHHARVWLVNTGWGGGTYGTGKRIVTANKLAGLFRENFKKYESGVTAEIKAATPV